jgi:two-component system, chemotaxis family, protein-glutamate methylesterase/glutaminase
VVDDSASARALLVHILGSDPEITVVGQATDGIEAVAAVEHLHPDVVTMDVVMPEMDGLAATRRIMAASPTPIVIVASHNPDDDRWVFRAIEAGALTVLGKPEGPSSPRYDEQARALVSTVKLIAGVRVAARSQGRRRRVQRPATDSIPSRRVGILAIAASTGGPAAVAEVVRELPGDFAVPVLLVQHIAVGFDSGFAQWLDSVCAIRVRLANGGEALKEGTMLVAPTDRHLGVTSDHRAWLSDEAPIGGFRPSATFLFRSVANVYGSTGLGLVLTGMGRDGAEGLIALRGAGGYVLAQDEATSIVFGMPGAAIASGGTDRVLALDEIGPTILKLCRTNR